ncbi:nocardicin N-oxygenase [Prauserella shujinwangii]|uniref:Nocardicin N-oxygenase n=1 Tax=Prauserella shujinwangii TaxID=1453103 RepID=A0A2T0LSJ0_9PSEU|nr:cytochrome P450 [Prauserella shujinwangii]PRX46637.1 nocardicin N-oxygenase [Prauserella shujinwangii]
MNGRPRYPFARESQLVMPREFAWLRERDPVCRVTLPHGREAVLLTRYDDIRAALSERRLSSRTNRPGSALEGSAPGFGNAERPFSDPPEHTRWRALVAGAFTARRVAALRPRVQDITDGLLDAMAAHGPPADLMAGLALPVPVAVICELLGVPAADQAEFRDWVDEVFLLPAGPERRTRALGALADYVRGLLAARRARPGRDDLLDGLLAVRDADDGRLTEDELVQTVMILLAAGYKSTAAQIGRGVLTLLRHRDQLAVLRADPGLVPAAVEELLRYAAPGNGLGVTRYATGTLDIGGVRVPEGTVVVLPPQAANRDPRRFPRPDRFDVCRAGAARHLAFGAGPHFCLGAALARLELQVVFDRLLRRFPGIELAIPPGELRWPADGALQGPDEVPLRW